MSEPARRAGTILLVLGLVVATAPTAYAAATTPPLDRTQGDRQVSLTVGRFGTAANGAVEHFDGGGVAWTFTGAVSYSFVQWVNDTHLLVGVHRREDRQCGRFDPPCGRTGVVLLSVANGKPTIDWEWTFPVASGRNSEVHDAEVIGTHEIVIADMDRERILILNRTTKRIVWEWRASSVYERPADPLRTDWLHINDVDHLGDGRFLVSVRNTNQLLIIKREPDGGSHVVETINKDRDPQTLYQQHNPQWLGDGRVLVADSENDRIVELQRQPDGEWAVVWQLSQAGGIGFAWPRDADRLPNGDTLVTDTRNARVVRVRPNGELVWSQKVGAQPYDADIAKRREPDSGPASQHGDAIGVPTPPRALQHIYSLINHHAGFPPWFREWQLVTVFIGVVLSAQGLTFRHRLHIRLTYVLGKVHGALIGT